MVLPYSCLFQNGRSGSTTETSIPLRFGADFFKAGGVSPGFLVQYSIHCRMILLHATTCRGRNFTASPSEGNSRSGGLSICEAKAFTLKLPPPFAPEPAIQKVSEYV